jgi:hypothetical protein
MEVVKNVNHQVTLNGEMAPAACVYVNGKDHGQLEDCNGASCECAHDGHDEYVLQVY